MKKFKLSLFFACMLMLLLAIYALAIDTEPAIELDKSCECEYKVIDLSSENIIYGGTVDLECKKCGTRHSQELYQLIEPLGYSISSSVIGTSYYIHGDIIKAIMEFNDSKIYIGTIIATKEQLRGKLPLNSKGDVVNNSITLFNYNGIGLNVIDSYVSQIEEKHTNIEFLFCAYMIINDNTYYIQPDGIKTKYDELKFVCYNDFVTEPEEINGFGNVQAEPSADRLKQQENSTNDYNTEKLSQDTIDDIIKRANLIITGGKVLSCENASRLLSHFLGGSGNSYNFNIDEFMKDETALYNRNFDIDKALRACESIARCGKRYELYQAKESLYHNLSGDYKYALGSYFSSIEITDISVYQRNGKTVYSAKLKYIVTDFYNWDKYDTNKFLGFVSPSELHSLHMAGVAKEFLTYGEKVYDISWIQGQCTKDIGI
ncbi:MAG: hypothetical protein J6K52_07835 [Clostridia bacterium]|nr:hypothetical protein [Clostridia bacterium]